MEIGNEGVNGRLLAAEGGETVAADPATEAIVPTTASDEGTVLKGNGVANVVHVPKGVLFGTPSKEEVLMDISRQMYASMETVVNNLKPSKKVTENIRRRQKEIRKIQQEIRERKIDHERARIQLINMIDSEDRAELARQSDKAAEMIKC